MSGRVCRTEAVREDQAQWAYVVTAGAMTHGFDDLIDAMHHAVECFKADWRPVYIDDMRRGIRYTAGRTT